MWGGRWKWRIFGIQSWDCPKSCQKKAYHKAVRNARIKSSMLPIIVKKVPFGGISKSCISSYGKCHHEGEGRKYWDMRHTWPLNMKKHEFNYCSATSRGVTSTFSTALAFCSVGSSIEQYSMNMLWWQTKANPMMPMAGGRPVMSKYFQLSSPFSVFFKIIFWVASSLSVKSRMNTERRMKRTKMILSELHFARRDMSLQVQLQW